MLTALSKGIAMQGADQSVHEEEVQLMRLAQQDPRLFEPLYQRYFDRVYAYCLRRTSHSQDAEDLCSQVFSQVLAHLDSYRGGMVAAWLFRIAHNVVANYHRSYRPNLPLESASSLPAQTELFEGDEDRYVLAVLLAQLPADERELLALALDADLTSGQIGAILGKNAGAVRVQLHRVIRKLRDQFQHMRGEESHE